MREEGEGRAEGEDVPAEAEGPEGGSGEEQGSTPHAEGAGGEAQAASTKKPPERPAWRKKRPSLFGNRVKDTIERNFEKAEEAFQSIDVNLDGKISMRELRAALASIDTDYHYTDEELRAAIMIADADGSGAVDVEEFMRAFCPHPVTKEEVQDGLHNLGRTADGRKLTYLSLALPSLNLSDISLLRGYSQLRFMDVSNNKLTDLSPLGCLPFLLTLHARKNMLTSVLDFKAPLCLREADLSDNRIYAMNSVSAHRFLEELNLSGNRIREISGVRDNVALRKLIMDKNGITSITNLGNLPLRVLSLARNGLTAVNGYLPLSQDEAAVFGAFEETYEEMEIAFEAFDANMNGSLDAHEFREGLKMVGIQVTQETFKRLIAMLDKSGNGIIELNEFLTLYRRSKPEQSADPGISLLRDLQEINLSENSIESLRGLEGHLSLQKVDMSSTAVQEMREMEYIKGLPVLEDLDMSGTPLFTKNQSAAKSSCARLRALYMVSAPQGKAKLMMLNQQLVTAEELVCAANFHDSAHRQHKDLKRDDSQDLPPALFL